VMAPGAKCFLDGEELFVMGVIVEFRSGEGPGVEHNQAADGKDASDGVVRGISLNDDRGVRHPMCQNRSGGEGIFQVPESRAAFNNNVGVVINETTIEVGETEE
ncbi:hypothetical protein PAXRUDRAFT_156070, partial [Paxillus rubicundulus Ve08.2h10]